jgi:hypothetical protein
MNKACAAQVGEELAETEQIIWLDSDVLVVSEPNPLLLKPNEDFACAAINKNVGSSGPGDPYEAYWKALSECYGMSIENLPWVRQSGTASAFGSASTPVSIPSDGTQV